MQEKLKGAIGLGMLAAIFLKANPSFAQTGLSPPRPPNQSEFGVDRRTLEKGNRPLSVQVVLPATVLADPLASPTAESKSSYSLDDLIRIGLERHPRLAQAAFSIDAARGRALQAGLYPNPTIAANFDELGDKTGPAGVNTLPQINQEIVTGG